MRPGLALLGRDVSRPYMPKGVELCPTCRGRTCPAEAERSSASGDTEERA
jgi:hypothetical protein